MSERPPRWAYHAVIQRLQSACYRRFGPEPYRSVLRYTMVGVPRLKALRRLATEVVAEQVPGDFVECGVWRGGTGALLAEVAAADGRRTWLFDSFQGMPQAGEADGSLAARLTGECRGEQERVEEALASRGVPRGMVEIRAGWFEETFPAPDIERVALLHVDADWYDSVKLCLETFYPRLSPGGVVVLDDYGYWPGARKAVDEFLASNEPTAQIRYVDWCGRYFRKPR